MSCEIEATIKKGRFLRGVREGRGAKGRPRHGLGVVKEKQVWVWRREDDGVAIGGEDKSGIKGGRTRTRKEARRESERVKEKERKRGGEEKNTRRRRK